MHRIFLTFELGTASYFCHSKLKVSASKLGYTGGWRAAVQRRDATLGTARPEHPKSGEAAKKGERRRGEAFPGHPGGDPDAAEARGEVDRGFTQR